MDVTLASPHDRSDPESVWSGQPLRLRGVLRDGTALTVGLSLTECSQLYLMLQGDLQVRSWATAMAARFSEPAKRPNGEH